MSLRLKPEGRAVGMNELSLCSEQASSTRKETSSTRCSCRLPACLSCRLPACLYSE